MKIEFVNPFVTAAGEVLEKETGAIIRRGRIYLQSATYTCEEITAMVAVTGQVSGIVLYALSINTALQIVGHMLGQPFHEFDELAQSGIAELGNVITGKASILLANN